MQNLKIHDRNGSMLFATAVDPTDLTPLRTAVNRDELLTLEVALGLNGAVPLPDTSPERLRGIVSKLAGTP